MKLIEVKGISKSFGENEVVRETSFMVRGGDSIAFTSPSGSGKSTLLSMVGLLLTPDTGQILMPDGMDALTLDDKAKSRLRQQLFGFVFQSTQLVGSLRAVENVTAPTGFAGKLDFDAEERAKNLLEQFGLSDRMYHYPHQLSVGQKRRVSVARALILQPKIVIADEPTNDLDEESADVVTRALFEYAEQGNALLYATHIKELASKADVVMTMKDKAFVQAG